MGSKDKRGNKVRASRFAANEAALRADLRAQGVAATRVKTPSTAFRSGGKVLPTDIAVFARQLATMLAAGIPMVQAFEISATAMKNRQCKSWCSTSSRPSKAAARCMRRLQSILCILTISS